MNFSKTKKLVLSAMFLALGILLPMLVGHLFPMGWILLPMHVPVLLCGLILGALSSFLGIGGGPFNVAIILFVIGCDMRMAAVYSILTILFSQLSKLVTVAFTTGYAQYDLSVLPIIVLCGVAGGFLGAKFNTSLHNKAVERCFNIMQIIILCITLSNIVRYGLL